MKKMVFGFTLFVANLNCLQAQRIFNNTTFRQLTAPAYFRFHYDNDYFTKTDYYYSQGITIELVHPNLKKNPLNKLLLTPYNAPVQYGLTFNLFGYTPTSIASNDILYSDRPFNANVSLKSFTTQIDAKNKAQLNTALSLGVMGRAAGGYAIQYNIHKWLENPLPLGWQHQIKNDAIVNYQLNYEKQLLQASHYFLLNGTAEARVGTLNNSLSTGFNFMVGRFNKRFDGTVSTKRKAEYYFYFQNNVNGIAYDATQQGGIFNRKSPYTIAAKNINRITYRADAGMIVNFKKLFFSYTQSFITKEFKQGKTHRWGGVSVGCAL
jgi:lipid A 3-O-deacylase